MPIIVKMQDGSTMQFPSGTPLDQIQQSIGRPQPDYRPDDPTLLGSETLGRTAVGLGRGMMNLYEGAKQAGMHAGEAMGLVEPESVQSFEQQVLDDRDIYRKSPAAQTTEAKVGETAGEFLPLMAVPAASMGATLPARLAINMGTGAGIGGLQYADTPGERVQNVGASAIASAAGGEAMRGLFKLARKAYTGLGNMVRGDAAVDEIAKALPTDVPQHLRLGVARSVVNGLPEDQAVRLAQYQDIGMSPTKGQITRDFTDLQFENRLAAQGGDDIADAFRAKVDRNNSAVLGRLDDYISRQGGTAEDIYASGRAVKGGIDAGKRAMHADTNLAYQSVTDTIDQAAPVRLSGFVDKLDEVADLMKGDETAGIFSRLRKLGVIDADNAVVGDLTPEKAEVFRRFINDKIAGADRQAAMHLGKLRKALEDDITASLGDDVFSGARAVARDEFAMFDNRKIVKAIMDERLAPDDIVKRSISGSWKVKDVGQLVDTLGSKAPDSLAEFRTGVMRQIADESKLAELTLSGNNKVSGTKLKRSLQKIGREKLVAIFGEDEAQSLWRFANVVDEGTNQVSGTFNPSRSGDTLLSWLYQKARHSRLRGVPLLEDWFTGTAAKMEAQAGKAAIDPVPALISSQNRAATQKALESVPGQYAARAGRQGALAGLDEARGDR